MMKLSRRIAGVLVAVLALAVFPQAAFAQITVMTSGAFTPALKLMAVDYEMQTGNHLDLVLGTSAGTDPTAIPVRLANGEKADIVILADNDKSGREYAHRKAASLRGIARRIRVLEWREHWPMCPEGGDATDWRDLAGGTKDKLFAIVDKLPDWTPVWMWFFRLMPLVVCTSAAPETKPDELMATPLMVTQTVSGGGPEIDADAAIDAQ